MSFTYGAKSVTGTAVDLTDISSGSIVAGFVKNLGPEVVYVGDSSVADSSGYPLAEGESMALDAFNNTSVGTYSLYGVTSGGTSDVRVIVWSE